MDVLHVYVSISVVLQTTEEPCRRDRSDRAGSEENTHRQTMAESTHETTVAGMVAILEPRTVLAGKLVDHRPNERAPHIFITAVCEWGYVK